MITFFDPSGCVAATLCNGDIFSSFRHHVEPLEAPYLLDLMETEPKDCIVFRAVDSLKDTRKPLPWL